jgi:hypothetical protein
MTISLKTLFDSSAPYNSPQMQLLDLHIEQLSQNYFNKDQNYIRVINGGYEVSISSYLYHELYREDNSAYLEQKIYIAPNIAPKPDMFFTESIDTPTLYLQFCNARINTFCEFGHHFSFTKTAHINKTLSDFVKWRKLFHKYNFAGEIITVQYLTHLTNINEFYTGHAVNGMAAQNINLNNLALRNQNIADVANIYKAMGTLKKHSEITCKNDNIQFSIHIFINLFPKTITPKVLYGQIPQEVLQVDAIAKNRVFWK